MGNHIELSHWFETRLSGETQQTTHIFFLQDDYGDEEGEITLEHVPGISFSPELIITVARAAIESYILVHALEDRYLQFCGHPCHLDVNRIHELEQDFENKVGRIPLSEPT